MHMVAPVTGDRADPLLLDLGRHVHGVVCTDQQYTTVPKTQQRMRATTGIYEVPSRKVGPMIYSATAKRCQATTPIDSTAHASLLPPSLVKLDTEHQSATPTLKVASKAAEPTSIEMQPPR